MWKYYALLFAAVVAILAYTYVADPCHKLLRTDFAQQYPSYEIAGSGADKGSPEAVRCRVSYRKPGDEKVYEEIWLYTYQATRWKFSKVIETENGRQTPP